ncbi:hypothetical protein M430DRAFT_57530 [Amorphotheca resinae ATCC 22711]|uniref:SET domain-containing protein n=1 Tax=Amorphotheca resinae ATCC 22711 TaxID=857342 RepID=A0A2T3B5Y7_AMORE|nr:hypothetical protein M430DRAFT_57530 [Amorphotheca resinae ATCC 22711]PSS22175.1 hypothetical protein M430DRAFT_57530 [Amorphotheca resinae ATCC 22711]
MERANLINQMAPGKSNKQSRPRKGKNSRKSTKSGRSEVPGHDGLPDGDQSTMAEKQDLADKGGGSTDHEDDQMQGGEQLTAKDAEASVIGDPLFEIKRVKRCVKDFGLFARRPIDKGTVIFKEAPAIEGAQSWLMGEAKFMTLSETKKKAITDLQSRCRCRKVPCIESKLTKLFYLNAFDISAQHLMNRHEAIQTTKFFYLYTTAARINHSCVPNTAYGFTKNKEIFIEALKDIDQGKELTIDYIGAHGETSFRRKILKDVFGFHCRCTSCRNNKLVPEGNRKVGYIGSDLEEEQIPQSEVIGRLSKAEIDRADEVHKWWEQMKSHIRFMVDELRSVIEQLAIKGLIDSDSKLLESIIEEFEDNFRQDLRNNNRFGLDEDVLKVEDGKVPQMLQPARQLVNSIREMNSKVPVEAGESEAELPFLRHWRTIPSEKIPSNRHPAATTAETDEFEDRPLLDRVISELNSYKETLATGEATLEDLLAEIAEREVPKVCPTKVTNEEIEGVTAEGIAAEKNAEEDITKARIPKIVVEDFDELAAKLVPQLALAEANPELEVSAQGMTAEDIAAEKDAEEDLTKVSIPKIIVEDYDELASKPIPQLALAETNPALEISVRKVTAEEMHWRWMQTPRRQMR